MNFIFKIAKKSIDYNELVLVINFIASHLWKRLSFSYHFLKNEIKVMKNILLFLKTHLIYFYFI